MSRTYRCKRAHNDLPAAQSGMAEQPGTAFAPPDGHETQSNIVKFLARRVYRIIVTELRRRQQQNCWACAAARHHTQPQFQPKSKPKPQPGSVADMRKFRWLRDHLKLLSFNGRFSQYMQRGRLWLLASEQSFGSNMQLPCFAMLGWHQLPVHARSRSRSSPRPVTGV